MSDDNFNKDNPQLELAAESFDTDAAIMTGGSDLEAVLGAQDEADALAEQGESDS